MEYTDTAKTRHAIHLLCKTGIYSDLEGIIWDCAEQAYGEQCYSYDFESYEKNGYIHFMHRYFPIGVIFGGVVIEGDAYDRIKHFEDGFMAKAFYDFSFNHNIQIKFIFRDSYVKNESEYFNLFVDLFFEDFQECYGPKVNAYTHPIFDSEEGISQTLLWRELGR